MIFVFASTSSSSFAKQIRVSHSAAPVAVFAIPGSARVCSIPVTPSPKLNRRVWMDSSASPSRQKRSQVALQQQLQDMTMRCRVCEGLSFYGIERGAAVQVLSGHNGGTSKSVSAAASFLYEADQWVDWAVRVWGRRVRRSQKEEMKKQAEAYEQQANGLRQQVDLVNQREKQRVAAIKARVGLQTSALS